MPQLKIKYRNRPLDIFPLERLRLTIGRSVRNDLCLPDPFASRVHAELRRDGGRFFIRDLGSANGTFFNGERIDGWILLINGSRIYIGETELEFKDDSNTLINKPTQISDSLTLPPDSTITITPSPSSTSGLLQAIEGARIDNNESRDGKHIEQQSDLLALISKVGVTLLASATLDETLQQIAALVFEAVPADRCLISIIDEESKELKVRVAKLRDDREVEEFVLSRSIIEEVIDKGSSILTADLQQDPRFAGTTTVIQGIYSVLAVPLGVGSKIFGIIYADSPVAVREFTEDHLKVLTTLASVAAIRVENARLLEERLRRERLERELQLAREIQQRFQPTEPPHMDGYEFVGISFPSYEIGGDYYDFVRRPNGDILIALGDVSGKATSAALLMSSLHAAVHTQAYRDEPLINTVEAINRYLAFNIPSNRFITLFCAELDPSTGTLTYINAGHNPPFIMRVNGSIETFEASSIPLGISQYISFQEGKTRLDYGDVLVIYSDGVTETQNLKGEEFGEERLHEVVSRSLTSTASSIRDSIEAAITKFGQGASATDDITLVIVKREYR
jgi:phosphoserine phosphatase RsbU/P